MSPRSTYTARLVVRWDFEITTLFILAMVVIGTTVQTITGFAMGLIIVAGVTMFSLADIGFIAAVISIISLVNVVTALRRGYKHVDWHFVRNVLLGLLPTMLMGYGLLFYLSENNYDLLRTLLGVVIIMAGVLLMIAPKPFAKCSSAIPLQLCGGFAGFFAGLYSAAGAPIAYFMYRQPVSLLVIRNSLMMIFGVSTVARTVLVAASGALTTDVLITSALSIPLVIATTIVTNRYVHLVPDKLVRQMVFLILVLAGLTLIATSMGVFD